MITVIGMQYLLPTKKQKEFTMSVVCGAITNFIINMYLIRKYGAIGAAIATFIAEFIVTTIQLILVRKTFEFKNIMKITKPYLISSVIMFIICLMISNIIKSNFYSIVLQVIIGGATYFILLLIMKDSFLIETKNTIIKYISRVYHRYKEKKK